MPVETEGAGNAATPEVVETQADAVEGVSEGHAGSGESGGEEEGGPDSVEHGGDSAGAGAAGADALATIRGAIEQLLDPEKAPDWLKGMAHHAEAEGVDSFKVDLSKIEDSDARRYLFNQSRWLQRVASEMGQQRKQALDQENALKAERAALADREAQLLRLFQDPKLAEVLQVEVPEDLDPLSPEGIRADSQKGAAEVVGKFLETITERQKAMTEEAERQKAELAAESAQRANIEFAKSKQDFKELYPEIKRLYEGSQFSLEECYEMARALAGKNRPAEDPRDASRRAMGRNGGRPSGGPPKGASPEELLRWARQNPHDAKVYMEKTFGAPNGYVAR